MVIVVAPPYRAGPQPGGTTSMLTVDEPRLLGVLAVVAGLGQLSGRAMEKHALRAGRAGGRTHPPLRTWNGPPSSPRNVTTSCATASPASRCATRDPGCRPEVELMALERGVQDRAAGGSGLGLYISRRLVEREGLTLAGGAYRA